MRAWNSVFYPLGKTAPPLIFDILYNAIPASMAQGMEFYYPIYPYIYTIDLRFINNPPHIIQFVNFNMDFLIDKYW